MRRNIIFNFVFGRVPSGYKLSEVVHDHRYESSLFYPSLEMCEMLETVIVSKTLPFTQLAGRSADEYLFHIRRCGSCISYFIVLEILRIFSSPLNYVATIKRSVNFMREYRNFSCHLCAAVGSDAGAAVVRARGWPKNSRMWRQILPIWSAAVKTACVSYAMPDSSYISVWLVPAVL